MTKLTWPKALAWRLQRHHLQKRASRKEMLEVAANICGLHAQLLSSAELSLWARVDELEKDAVDTALWQEKTLLKTWAMRGTLHLIPSHEHSLWYSALGTHTHYLKPAWLRYFGVSAKELEKLLAAMSDVLAEGPLTREELAEAVQKHTRSKKFGEGLRQSWGSLLKPAAFRGQLCFAEGSGSKVRFARPDVWLGKKAALQQGQEALKEIARRFFAAYSPATREDFCRWWGLQAGPANRLLAALGDELVKLEIDGTTAYLPAEQLEAATEAEPQKTVRLLPAFDPWVIGATAHAEKLLPGDYRKRVYRNQGWLSPVMLVDGKMDAIWRHEKKGKTIEVEIEPLTKLPAWAKKEAEKEAEKLAQFLGGALSLSWKN